MWDTTTVHLSLDGVHLKTVPSRQTTVSLTRLRAAGARPAGPPPRRAIAMPRPARDHNTAEWVLTVAVEVDRVVNASGLVSLSGRYRLHGVRLAGPNAPVAPGPLRVQRRVSSGGVTQVAGQTLRVGFAHRHALVDIDVHETEYRVYDLAGEALGLIPRTSGKEVTRTKGYGVRDHRQL